METGIRWWTGCGAAVLALVAATSGLVAAQAGYDSAPSAAAAEQPAAGTYPWPLQYAAGTERMLIYPPEIERFEGGLLEGTCAVSVSPVEASDVQPRFGILRFVGHAQPDARDPQALLVRDLRATKLDFPAAPERSETLLQEMDAALRSVSWQTTRNRLENSVDIGRAQAQARATPLRNDVPRIVFAEQPSVLVRVDGPPAMRDVPGTRLQRVINTRALMLYDPAARTYLLYQMGRWLESPAIDGTWRPAVAVSADMEEARRSVAQTGEVDLLDAERDQYAAPPQVFVTTEPTELVQFQGVPQWAAIPGTQLLYVSNTTGSVFHDVAQQTYFVLLAGRWYRSSRLGGADWSYVSPDRLPPDFARVPDGHPADRVLSAVPGTPEAQEAVVAARVPQTARVERSRAPLQVDYDGPPRFEPIPGTNVDWAVNSRVPVLRVSGNRYYALDNGVWFTSAVPDGEWSVADYVPSAIYTIPPSSPVHYVTYVRVYDATTDSVFFGYTPGYFGWYPTYSQTVVYGTGFVYHPWVHTAWYGWPSTWGFSFSYGRPWWWAGWPGWFYAWNPWPCYRPWWGPVWSHPYVRPSVQVNNYHVTNVNVTRVNNVYERWAPSPLHVRPTPAAQRFAGLDNRPAPGFRWAPDANGGRRLERDPIDPRLRRPGGWANAASPRGNLVERDRTGVPDAGRDVRVPPGARRFPGETGDAAGREFNRSGSPAVSGERGQGEGRPNVAGPLHAQREDTTRAPVNERPAGVPRLPGADRPSGAPNERAMGQPPRPAIDRSFGAPQRPAIERPSNPAQVQSGVPRWSQPGPAMPRAPAQFERPVTPPPSALGRPPLPAERPAYERRAPVERWSGAERERGTAPPREWRGAPGGEAREWRRTQADMQGPPRGSAVPPAAGVPRSAGGGRPVPRHAGPQPAQQGGSGIARP
jgi:hypothetical protein